MSIEPGLKIGPYEVLSPLGAGGMGEVYKAKDTRLDRCVAIKVLPSELARDPSRKARLEREAKAISQLNHAHICTLHDIGAHEGIDYLVMEYIEGETLADRLKRGALPLEKVLELARQMASALAAAHERGIVHRDLKPSNVMLTKSGVKLLDFGLAKWEEKAGSVAPTAARPLTQQGALLGTIPYMAPEQLEGKEADARSDIYAFGAVLYEMVTGRRTYDEERKSPLSPQLLQTVVSKALGKSPDDRWQSVRDIELLLESVEEPEAIQPTPKTSRVGERLIWACLIALTAAGAWWARPVSRGEVNRLTVTLPEGESLHESASPPFAISPDGRRVVYASRRANETSPKLYLRDLDSFETRLIPGTADSQQPVFSPDGEFVAFLNWSSRFLHKVPIQGGAVVRLCEMRTTPRGLAWTERGDILFGSTETALGRVPATGGTPESVTTLGANETGHFNPNVLPDERGILFTVGRNNDRQVALLAADAKEHQILFEGLGASYVSSGHIVFARSASGMLFAVPFDIDSLEVRGPPFQLEDTAALNANLHPQFRVGRDGTLLYPPGVVSGSEVVWVGRGGGIEVVGASEHRYHTPSPLARWEKFRRRRNRR
jgi:serine/threonine protein kinase